MPEMDISQLVPQTYIDFFQNITPESILDSVVGLTLSEDGNTAGLTMLLGGDTIIALRHQRRSRRSGVD